MKSYFFVFLSTGPVAMVGADRIEEALGYIYFYDSEGNEQASFKCDGVLGWSRGFQREASDELPTGVAVQ